LRDFPAPERPYRDKNRFLISSSASWTFEPRTDARRHNRSVTESSDKIAMKTAMETAASKLALSGHSASVPTDTGKGLLTRIAAFWREFIQTAFTPYYPERHYMRGPGPACAAKRKAAKA
jgi:hypothetical protein